MNFVATVLIFFLFCLFFIDAIVLKSHIRSAPKNRLSDQKKVSANKFVTGTANVTNFQEIDYLMVIYIGTPVQPFRVAFQINSNFTFVLDSSYAQIPCVLPNGTVESLPKFNSGASSSYVAQPQIPPWSYLFANLSGFWGSDTVCLDFFPQICAQNQLFGQATSAENAVIIDNAEDGNVGLRPDGNSVFANILPQLDAPMFTVAINSQITFGAFDSSNCNAQSQQNLAVVADTSGVYYWSVAINSVSVGSSSYAVAGLAGIEPVNAFINGPAEWLTGVAAELNATFNSELKLYVLPCAGVYPDIVLQLPTVANPSATFSVPSSQYIASAGLADPSICYLQLNVATVANLGALLGNVQWVIGDTFFREYCVVFDVANQQIGIANTV